MTPRLVNRFAGWLYLAAMTVILFTGFGNMPLYRRYYVTDLPGFAWTGNFLINVQVHYLAGAVLLGLAAYFMGAYAYLKKDGWRLTLTGRLRAMVVGLALLSGLAMALKNLAGVVYPFPLLVTMNFLHLTLAMIFLLLAAGCLIARAPWLRQEN
ncbi:MAG: hypothetical protein ACOC3F_01930 [Desulfosudaceae bacterium]